jgi:ammonium transporter, Amt family
LSAAASLLVALPAGAQDQAQAASRSADIGWVMAAAGMVMMMQVGFLLLEAGMVRSKNLINVV